MKIFNNNSEIRTISFWFSRLWLPLLVLFVLVGGTQTTPILNPVFQGVAQTNLNMGGFSVTNSYFAGNGYYLTNLNGTNVVANTITAAALSVTNSPTAGNAFLYPGYWGSAGGGGGSGTVTNFTAPYGLQPFFNTTVASNTYAPYLSFTFSNAPPYSVWGNFTGSYATPGYSTNPTFSGSNILNINGTNITAGTITNSVLPVATSTQLGVVKPDGTTITISGGVISSVSGGSGTVTSFSAGNLSPLFTSSVATSTSTPALTFSLTAAAQNSVFAGPASGGSGSPSFQTAPTISGANITALNGSNVSSGTVAATYLPTATSSAKGVIQGDGATTTITSGTLSVTTATTSQLGAVKPDGTIITDTAGVITVPSATGSAKGVVQGDGSTITLSSGVISATTATTGQLGVVKPDGTSITISSGVISASAGTATVGGRNRIINGDFNINQWGATTVPTGTSTSTTYLIDRLYGYSTTAAPSVAQQATFATFTASGGTSGGSTITTASTTNIVVGMTILGTGVPANTTITAVTANTSVTISNNLTATGSGIYQCNLFPTFQKCVTFTGITSNAGLYFGQKIEASNVYDQTSSEGSMELSVWLVASTAKTVSWGCNYPTGGVDNWSGRGSLQSGTFSVTTTPTRFTATILGSNIPLGVNGMSIEFSVSSLTSGQTLQMTGLQLEPGSTATTFEKLPANVELSECFRYYQQSYAYGTYPGAATHTGMYCGCASNSGSTYLVYAVYPGGAMRTAPTFAFWDGAGNASKTSYYSGTWYDNNSGTSVSATTSTSSMQIFENVAGGSNPAFHYTLNAEL